MKHPGTCAIKDDEAAILRPLAEADLQVWITPITYGGYAPALKRALDRFLPILLPFFTRRQGEAHHPLRYKRRRALCVIGTLAEADTEAEAIFHHLVGRNALNLASVLTKSLVLHAGEEEGSSGDAESLLEAAEEAL